MLQSPGQTRTERQATCEAGPLTTRQATRKTGPPQVAPGPRDRVHSLFMHPPSLSGQWDTLDDVPLNRLGPLGQQVLEGLAERSDEVVGGG